MQRSKPDSSEEDSNSFFRYASSSLYSLDSVDELATVSLFERTYVSFPLLCSHSPDNNMTIPNNTLFTMPEVMAATATPLFCNKPHKIPIWITLYKLLLRSS